MVTGLLSFVVFILSFSLLTNGHQINNEQCPPIKYAFLPLLSQFLVHFPLCCFFRLLLIKTFFSIISTPPQEHIVRWTEGYKQSQYLDYLSSTMPPSGFAATQSGDGDTAALSEDVLECIAADSNAWSIPASGYVNIAGDKPAIFTMAKEEEDRRTETSAEEEKERQAKTEQPEWVGKQYIIGLRNNGDIEKHLALLPAELQTQVEQLIPEINGYAVPSTVSPNTLELIRKDPDVGFIVTKPRGFFSAEGGEALEGDEKEDYETERWWSTLQSQDPFFETTDNEDM